MTQTRDGCMPAYNNQAAICDKHKMILLWEVTNTANDRNNLKEIVEQVEQVYEVKVELARSDSDYFNTPDIQALEEQGTAVYCNVPKSVGRRQVEDEAGQPITFTYDAQADQYTCSKGQPLIFLGREKKGRRWARRYRGTQCQSCPLREQCTKGRQRTLYRYDDEEWIERYIKKMKSPQGRHHSALRRAYVEHPFGTVRVALMDRLQLKLRGKYKVQTEICLYHFAYNFKRLINLENFHYLMGLVCQYDFKIHKTAAESPKKAA